MLGFLQTSANTARLGSAPYYPWFFPVDLLPSVSQIKEAPAAIAGKVFDPNIPWWCGLSDWTGGWAAECAVPTAADIRAGQAATCGPGLTPENCQKALDAGDAAVAAYQAMHPEEAAAYDATIANQEKPTDWGLYALLAFAGLAAFAAVR